MPAALSQSELCPPITQLADLGNEWFGLGGNTIHVWVRTAYKCTDQQYTTWNVTALLIYWHVLNRFSLVIQLLATALGALDSGAKL